MAAFVSHCRPSINQNFTCAYLGWRVVKYGSCPQVRVITHFEKKNGFIQLMKWWIRSGVARRKRPQIVFRVAVWGRGRGIGPNNNPAWTAFIEIHYSGNNYNNKEPYWKQQLLCDLMTKQRWLRLPFWWEATVLSIHCTASFLHFKRIRDP